MKAIVFLAYKDLVRDRKIVLLVTFLLAFSYVNLTFFPAFLNGLSETFQSEIVDTGTSHIFIQPAAESNALYISSETVIRKKIDLIPGVIGSSSQIGLSGMASFEGKQFGIRITAMTPSNDAQVTTIREKILKGEFLEDSDTDSVVLGEIIAGRKTEDLIGKEMEFGRMVEGLGGADVGKIVRIKFSNGVEKDYKVKGIVGSFGFNIVSQTVYITKKEAENVLGIKDKASSILVRLIDKNQADKYKSDILELGMPNTDVQTWKEASTFAEGLNQTFGIVILVTTFVGVIVVITTIGIVIFINTSRKKRIIGVLKAIGMQKDQIMLVFLFESLIFGIIGTLIGTLIVYSSIFYMDANPILLPVGKLKPILLPNVAIQSVIILIASSVIAGYIPARMASRQEVLDNIKVVE